MRMVISSLTLIERFSERGKEDGKGEGRELRRIEMERG